MATFITLANYTAQGIANIKDSPGRLDAAREQLAPLGIEIKDTYLTMGEYDLVIVVEAPDNVTAAKKLLNLLGGQAGAHVIMGHDQGAGRSQRLVAAGVVTVPVRID